MEEEVGHPVVLMQMIMRPPRSAQFHIEDALKGAAKVQAWFVAFKEMMIWHHTWLIDSRCSMRTF